MASVAHGILSQPGISKILDAFQPMPQTGTILVPGIFAGKSSYQVPLTAKNAAKVGRSMRKMTEEAIRLFEESGRFGKIPISDGRWKADIDWIFFLDNVRSMGFSSLAGRQLVAIEKNKGLWIRTRWESPDWPSTCIWQEVFVNFPSPSVFRGKKPEVFTCGYRVSFSSEQAIFGLRKFLGMESTDWRAVFFELANRVYRSGQYTEVESKWIRASVLFRDEKQEVWAPVPEENGWRIPNDFPKEGENSWRWKIKSMEEIPTPPDGLNEPIFTVWWDRGDNSIQIGIRRPDKRKERLMPLQPSLQNLWIEAEKLIDNRHHI
jgi:hypothetical protein